MNERDLHGLVVDTLARVAPEIDARSLDPAVPLRDQVELDSMDFLNFIAALHETLGVDIPESAYPRFQSVNDAAAWLAGALAAGESKA